MCFAHLREGEKRGEGWGDNLGPYIFLSFGDCPHFLPQNKSSVERGRIGGKVEKKKGSLSGLSSPDFLGDGGPTSSSFFPAVLLLHTYLKCPRTDHYLWLQACKQGVLWLLTVTAQSMQRHRSRER